MNFFSQNLAKVSPKDGLTNLELETISTKFTEIYELAKSRQQGFWDLPDQNIDSILEFAKKTQGKFTDIVILGIGGSMLGPICLLGGFEKQTVGKNPKVHCLDNIDSDQISLVESQINLEKTLFLVQTKSGTTPETLAQYFYFRSLVEKNDLDVKEHFVFITDPEVGYLRQVAIREHITSFAIPANVGGRFSVLSPVGLVIGALYGLDIAKILIGAKNSLSEKALKSSFDLACIQYLLSQKGKSINVLMPYSSRLRLLANWYTQLLSESIGKEYNLKGQIVNTGITPLPALGATDQHSQLQLFKEGVNDKLLIFINVLNKENSVLIGQNLPDAFDYLNGKTFDDLLQAEFKGTVQSLTESSRPNVTLEIEKLDETSLGEIFMFFQVSVAFLGELLEINTFDQHGVERSKILTREFLEK